MKVTIAKKVFRKFPKLRVAVLLVDNLDNSSRVKEAQNLLKEVSELIQLSFNKDTIKTHHLIAPWAVAQEEFGRKAKHYHTSVERLIKKVLKKRSLKAGDTLTNLLRFVSLKHIIPSGIDDANKVRRKLTFSISTGKEKVGIRNVLPGTLFYRDDKQVLGTKLDFWKNKKTALKKKSTSAIIHFEALPPITNKKLQEVTKEMSMLVQDFCGGQVEMVTLSKAKPSVLVKN